MDICSKKNFLYFIPLSLSLSLSLNGVGGCENLHRSRVVVLLVVPLLADLAKQC